MNRRRSKRDQPSRYVALSHWMMRTAAWRDLDCVARCVYVEIARRYAGPGSNNGRIRCSIREIAEQLNVSKATAMRALQRLGDHGFIAQTKRGTFNFKTRHASEWRLTEYGCDVTGELPSKDFARWQPVVDSPVKNKNTVSPEVPNGCRDETARVPRRNAVTPKSASTVSPDTRQQHPRFHPRYEYMYQVGALT